MGLRPASLSGSRARHRSAIPHIFRSSRTKTSSMGMLAMACPLGLSVATLSPDLDSDQDGSGGVAAVTRIRVSGTSVFTSGPRGQGVAQSRVSAISHPGDVTVTADHHRDPGAY